MENLSTKNQHQKIFVGKTIKEVYQEIFADTLSKLEGLAKKRLKLINDCAPIEEIMLTTAEMGKVSLEGFYQVELDYNLEGLSKVMHYLTSIGTQPYTVEDEIFVNMFGAFVGEALIREFNGKWEDIGLCFGKSASPIGCVIIDKFGTNPFLSVSRQLESGVDNQVMDYIRGFQQLISNGQLLEENLLGVGEVWHLNL